MTAVHPAALTAATSLVLCLSDPGTVHTCPSQHRTVPQSLANGAVGIALLHAEQARTHHRNLTTVHTWLANATGGNLSAGPNASLYFGVPALAFVIHAAGDHPAQYPRARATLHQATTALTRTRLDQAHARIDRGQRPALAEFDLLRGLTGLGAYHLRHYPDHELTTAVLSYLVRLTESHADGLPGWWTDLDPTGRRSTHISGGHSNFGIAHGICGVLALLGTAIRRGVTVDGHTGAITAICAHLDAWQREGESGPWWPQWITREELRSGRLRQPGALRPSWCYGTPGIARAQQIAAIAIGDTARQAMAEHAIAACLSDPVQLHRITDTGLCHGWSGLYQTAWRAAQDALTPVISTQLPHLVERLIRHAQAAEPHDAGLLDGAAGLALALHTAALNVPPISGWDACLLIT